MSEERGWNLNHMEEQEAEQQVGKMLCTKWGEEVGWDLMTFLPCPWKTEISNFPLIRRNWRIKTQTCLLSLTHPKANAQSCCSEQLVISWQWPDHSLNHWDIQGWIFTLPGSADVGIYYRDNLSNQNQSGKQGRGKGEFFILTPWLVWSKILITTLSQYESYQTAMTFSETISFWSA